jgi:hypothetical protein
MSVIMNAARFVIENMRTNYEYKGKRKKPVLVMMPYLFCHEKTDSGSENQHRYNAVMVTPVTVP